MSGRLSTRRGGPGGVSVGPKLYFLRHGQAGSRQDWHGDDSTRPLTDAGKKRMAREAAGIRALGLSLDLIISSPLVRAHQTAEIVAKAQDPPVRLVQDGRVGPGFGPQQLTAIIGEHRRAAALMFVGHEPDFSETIGLVTGGGRVTMKKGALACVELDDPGSAHGTLVWLIPARVLER
jgi:phosphohistidine phosphatase